MLLSMTGFGESRYQENGLTVLVEIRTINSRYFKLSVRSSEGYGTLEPLIEEAVRKVVHRGTVQISLRVERMRPADDYRINIDVLRHYYDQVRHLESEWKLGESIRLEALLPLEGVINEDPMKLFDASEDWPVIEKAINAALTKLTTMRAAEGRAMRTDLTANCTAITASLASIESRAPLVVDEYRSRLRERVQKTLQEFSVVLEPSDLIREVSLFADRADISEEIVRLRSHAEQFTATLDMTESTGRKLEFITQEMFRETNTIGSKSNDVEIARHVIEIKTAIERIREMIQNVE